MELLDFVIRIFVALAAGMLIGLERQLNQKEAGLRTNSLVALGAAVFVLISVKITAAEGGDVTRIIGQVVTGIGFIGAGVILNRGRSVKGLTTAATVWCSAGIGCLAASGFFLETAVCTVLVVFINYVLRIADDKIESFGSENLRKRKKTEKESS